MISQKRHLRAVFSVATLLLAQALPGATPAPLGFEKITMRGKTSGSNRVTLISLGLARPSVGQYVVSGTSLNSEGRTILSFTGTPFSQGQFEQLQSPHFAKIVNGTNAGTVSEIIGNGENTVALADNIQDVVINGETKIKIYPYWTLATAFPAGAGLGSGLSSASADNITILTATGSSQVYFFHSASGQWRRGTTNASNVKIPPGTGLMITRKRSGDVQLAIAGEVLTSPVEVLVGGGATGSSSTMLGNPFPVPLPNLRLIGLHTGNSTTGMAGGLSSSSADNLVVYDAVTSIPKTYYYQTSSGKWRSGITDASDSSIPEGSSFVITRKSSRPPFNWLIPAPEMNLE